MKLISFKQFIIINEGFLDDYRRDNENFFNKPQNKVHHNGSIAGIKNIAKNATMKQARFGVSKSGKLHYGDADQFIHHDLEDPNDHFVHVGVVQHNPKSNSYGYDSVKGRTIEDRPRSTNRLYKRFENQGIKKQSIIRRTSQKQTKSVNEMVKNIHDDVFHNTTATTIKRIAKHSAASRARFVITNDNKLHAADANNHLHDDIADIKDMHIAGMVRHEDGKYTHQAWFVNRKPEDKVVGTNQIHHPTHKHLDAIKAAGITHVPGSDY